MGTSEMPRSRAFTADLRDALMVSCRAVREAESLHIALDALPTVPDAETVTALRNRLTALLRDSGALRSKADVLIAEYAAAVSPSYLGSHPPVRPTRARREAAPSRSSYGGA